MEIGIITGSGMYALPGVEGGVPEPVRTQWGSVTVSRGTLAGVGFAHVSRHEAGHVRLSSNVAHRANVAALAQLDVDAVIALTVCGALDAAGECGIAMRDGGCYGHVDGPRFNTKAEIRGLAACGVTAVSQTAGPETVLCGEAELPYALLGY